MDGYRRIDRRKEGGSSREGERGGMQGKLREVSEGERRNTPAA